MNKRLTYILILIILLIGLYGAGVLVIEEFLTGEGCPKIIYIPVCLVVLICLVIPLGVHVLKKWNLLYFLFTGLAGSIALIASTMQFTGYTECPKTDSGTPMCYYSLLIFSVLVVTKVHHLKPNNQ